MLGEKISVVIPCYNCEKTLTRTVDSMLNQTESEFEIVLVNDGSTDNTLSICKKYESQDQRIRLISQDNKGLLNAWKAGVRGANGTYISFCDADDYVDLNFIKVMYEQIERQKCDLYLYGFVAEYENGLKKQYDNSIDSGIYREAYIKENILPVYWGRGGFEDGPVLASRCCKVFSKERLLLILDDLNDKVTNGEDELTTFAFLNVASSVRFINNFFPYHYVRNNQSMIGDYDPLALSKVNFLYREICNLARRYDYKFNNCIDRYFFNMVLLFSKKEITRNPNGKRDCISKLLLTWENKEVQRIMYNINFSGYNFASWLFAKLFINKKMHSLYMFTRIADKCKIGRP